MRLISALKRVCAALLLATGAGVAYADDYPSKPVRVVIPFPVGQATDILGRLIAQKLGDTMGKNFIIENRPGASGIIGIESVIKSAPDGYTLLVTASGTLVINPSLNSKLPYKPLEDLKPIALLGLIPLVVVAHPSLPAGTLAELIALAKAKPGELSYASSGSGTAQHLAMELLRGRSGMNLVHVPYKGSAPAVIDLLAGRVPLMFDTVASSLTAIKDGRLKALGVGLAQRSGVLPGVPTIDESGLKGFEVAGWAGLLAPAKTPDAIVEKVAAQVAKIVSQPDVRDRIVNLGMEPSRLLTREFGAFMKSETEKWAQAVKLAGVKAE